MTVEMGDEPHSDIKNPRRFERIDISLNAKGSTIEGGTFAVVVANLSRGGFMAFIEANACPGGFFDIALAAVAGRHARVIWRDGNRYGCEFSVPLKSLEMAT